MAIEIEPTARALGPADHGDAVSAEEFAAAEFLEPWTYEREAGRLVVVAPEGYDHQITAEPWRDALVFYKRDHPAIVRHVFSGSWLRAPGGVERVGDLGVYLANSPLTATPSGEPIPDLVFEIVSPGRASRERDYVVKRAEYHRLGVREYVIIDRFDRVVVVLTHQPEGYAERVLRVGDIYTTPLLPGLGVALAEVF